MVIMGTAEVQASKANSEGKRWHPLITVYNCILQHFLCSRVSAFFVMFKSYVMFLFPYNYRLILHGPQHAISSEGANKLKLFLKNVAHLGWATKKIFGF